MPAPHPAGLAMHPTTTRATALHMFYAERTDAMNARDPVLAPLAPPMTRPWGQLFLWTVGFGMSLVGFCVLVLIVAEASNG